MARHLTRIVPVDPLPDASLYDDGYPVLFQGVIHYVDSGAWVSTGVLVTTQVVGATPVPYVVPDGQPNTIVLADATSAAMDVTLPTAVTGVLVTVKKVDNVNDVTVGTPGSETIDGAATQVLTTQWGSLTFVSDGTNWFVA